MLKAIIPLTSYRNRNRSKMSFIRNFLDSPIKRNGKEPELLKTCCYYFSLKAGCRLIALFEALISVLAMYWSHQEVRGVRTSTTELLDLAFTREPVEELFGPETSGPILSANPYFSNALNTLTLLNSLILAVGTELVSKMQPFYFPFDIEKCWSSWTFLNIIRLHFKSNFF